MNSKEYLLSRKLVTFATCIAKKRAERVKPLNLTPQQAETIMYFKHNPGSCLSEFTKYLGTTHQTVSLMVDRLALKGFFIIEVGRRDARRRTARLTQKGLEMSEKITQSGFEVSEKLFAEFSEEEKEELNLLVSRALEKLENM